MKTTRLVLTLSAALIFAAPVAAQLPAAPPPHLALDEVVKVHQQLGLPVPPPDAELVRVNRRDLWWHVIQYSNGEEEFREVWSQDFLAFRLASPQRAADQRYLSVEHCAIYYLPFAWADATPPTIHALDSVGQSDSECLFLAIQCKLRGWDDLARGLYAKTRSGDREDFPTAAPKEFNEFDDSYNVDNSPIRDIYNTKLRILENQITKRGSDRNAIYRQLQLIDETPSAWGAPVDRGTLRRLELTNAPRRSKPGTVEALIDDLVDYWHDNEDLTNESGREAYWKLVEMGFDAVPALLDHLDDARYTRTTACVPSGAEWWSSSPLLVGDLAGEMIHRIAGGKIENKRPRDNRVRAILQPSLEPEGAHKLWEEMQRTGEEKWLLDRISYGGGAGKTAPTFNENVLRVLGAKYPKHLQQAYRSVIQNQLTADSEAFITPILTSRLTRDEKTALLLAGATSAGVRNRSRALSGLARFDPVLFRKHLLLALKKSSDGPEEGGKQLDDVYIIVPLVVRAQDAACWDALTLVGKKLPYGKREWLLGAVGESPPSDKPLPARRERLRFLVQFLDDRTTAPAGDDERDWGEIRDCATTQLMGIFRLQVGQYSGHTVIPDASRGPLTRFVLRAAVRQAAESELAQVVK